MGHHRLPAQDRPAPADADLAPDAQLPLLERHRRGAGAAAALHRGPERPRGDRRREPAAGAAGASTLWSPLPTRRSASPPSTWDRTRSSRASRSGSRTTSPASSWRRSRTRGPRSRRSPRRSAAFTTRPSTTRSCRARCRSNCASRWSAASSPRTSSSSTPRRTTSTSATSTSCRATSSARRDSHGKLGGKSSGLLLASQIVRKSRRVRRRARAHQDPKDVVRHVGRPPELRRVQPARGRLQPEVPRDRADPARVPAHRPGLQELPLLARRSSRASRWRSTTSRAGRSSSAARACSRTASARRSPASTRAFSWPTRAPRASA